MSRRVPVFDLDGTLVDSDAALLAPFTALGVPSSELGLPLDEACALAGVTVADYLAHYDSSLVEPFPGVADLLASLERWAVCSNKHPDSGRAELARLGWTPEVAVFAEPGAGPKALSPVLGALDLDPAQVVFVGDTVHDAACAAAIGCDFLLAGWNARARDVPATTMLSHPLEVLDHLLGS